MTRLDMFEAVRPFAPSRKFSAQAVRLLDQVADLFGLPASDASVMPDRQLIADLKRDEGLRLTAYQDTVGVWTVGYGQTGPHVKRGTVWTREQAEDALIEAAREHGEELERQAPWIAGLDPVRRRVLWNMAYNLGVPGLLGFRNTLAMVRAGDYAGAARGMLASKWARQVKGRAVRLARQMETGVGL